MPEVTYQELEGQCVLVILTVRPGDVPRVTDEPGK